MVFPTVLFASEFMIISSDVKRCSDIQYNSMQNIKRVVFSVNLCCIAAASTKMVNSGNTLKYLEKMKLCHASHFTTTSKLIPTYWVTTV